MVPSSKNCFKYVARPRIYSIAERSCPREGGVLAELYTEEENDKVAEYAKRQGSKSYRPPEFAFNMGAGGLQRYQFENVHIGLKQVEGENYKFVSGKLPTYQPWASGKGQKIVSLVLDKDGKGKWKGRPRYYTLADFYICMAEKTN